MRLIPTAFRRPLAARALRQAEEFEKKGRREEAIAAYELACRRDPSYSAPFFNLGLIYKYAGEWESSLRCNREAARLDPQDGASWWNMGVAATALERWDLARQAWTAFGLEIPAGAGPVDYPNGRSPIRLDPGGLGEVVWADRLDPARALLQNIPMPESGFRYRDVVLNDGAPAGYRIDAHGNERAVLDCLQLLQASPYSTFVAEVELAAALAGGRDSVQLVDRLSELADARDMSAEDWSTSTRVLCAACSQGRPHESHENHAHAEHLLAPRDGRHSIGVAARSRAEVRQLLDGWRAEITGIELVSLEEGLPAKAN